MRPFLSLNVPFIVVWCEFYDTADTKVSLPTAIGVTLARNLWNGKHYSDVIMSRMASQITSLKIDYSTVYSDTDQRKHQGSASLAFVRGNNRWPVNSPHKRPVNAEKCFHLMTSSWDILWWINTLRADQNGCHLHTISSYMFVREKIFSLQWRQIKRDDVSNHKLLHFLLNHIFGRRSK